MVGTHRLCLGHGDGVGAATLTSSPSGGGSSCHVPGAIKNSNEYFGFFGAA